MSTYKNDFDETIYIYIYIYIYFLIKDAELLEKYNEIWEKVKNSLKQEVDSELVYKISKS